MEVCFVWIITEIYDVIPNMHVVDTHKKSTHALTYLKPSVQVSKEARASCFRRLKTVNELVSLSFS